jgi:predicted GIY-YIG superfamily endonuclease
MPGLDPGIQSHKENNLASYVYILASERNGTLYIGVTSNFFIRQYQHREELIKGFTKRYIAGSSPAMTLYNSALRKRMRLKSGFPDISKDCHPNLF